MSKMLKKAGLGLVLGATVLTAAAPADAQRWRGRHYNRGGGDAAAGAILGGIVGLGVGAAIASSNRDRYYDRGGYYAGGPGYYAPPPQRYYPNYAYNDYRPRCWSEWRYDPYYRDQVRVRVCS